ncbi:hypothetical protein CY34DRAFT_101621, partial [Suillus luteus UH-Slu-Lm8-n1]
QAHTEGGHWGHDVIKIALLDCICCSKLDISILAAIKDCAKCKNFGPIHLHSLSEPITRCHQLLVRDYLSLPKGKGRFSTLGVYLDTFSQHIWIFKYKTAGSVTTTINSLTKISNAFIAPETFMADRGRHFNNDTLLLHVLKRLCAPELGEDNITPSSWYKLPNSWPDHLDAAIHALSNRLLPAFKFSPKELSLGLIVNTPPMPLEDSTSVLQNQDITAQIMYVEQQQLDGYEEAIRHTIKRKAVFDKRLLQ